LEVVTRVRGELLQRERVLWKTGTTPTQAGAKEVRAEAMVEPDAFGDLDDVGVGRLADVGDLVDERDPRHQERVRRELDHLSGVERERQALPVALEQLRDLVLVEEHLTPAQRFDLLGDDVADDDVMPELREARAGDQTHPARAEDSDPHSGLRPLAIASIVSF